MRLLALILAFSVALCGSVLAQGGMGPGPGMAHSAGGSPASFTFGSSGGSTGSQGTSPFVTAAQTFNTGASDLAIVAIVQANDFASGTLTGVTVTAVALTCVQGTNNASEQAWLCYGVTGTLTTATISIAFTGTILGNFSTGKVVTTTTTPYSTGNSTAAQGGGVTVPATVAATTGSGGIPASGVGLCVVGDFFASGRTFTSVTPTQADIINSATGNGQNLAFGSSTTSGSSSGVTVNGTASLFPSWACSSWSP